MNRELLKIKNMDDNKKFPEQVAPDKNTDKAFVKVARDGSPLIPGKEPKAEERPKVKPAPQPPRK
jgi:hypothetical protein